MYVWKEIYTRGLSMLFLNTHTPAHIWAQYVESEQQPRVSHGLSVAHRQICQERLMYIFIYIIMYVYTYLERDVYTRPIDVVSWHTHTHTWAQCVESEQQPRVGHGLSVAHAKYVKRDMYLYTYIFMYIYGDRSITEAYFCNFVTHTHTHLGTLCRKRTAASSGSRGISSSPQICQKENYIYVYIHENRSIHKAHLCCYFTHTNTHTPEQSVKKAHGSLQRVTCCQLLMPNMSKKNYTRVYIHRKRHVHEAYLCCFLTHTHTHNWTQCGASKRQPRASHDWSVANRQTCPKRILQLYIYIKKRRTLEAYSCCVSLFRSNTPEHSV